MELISKQAAIDALKGLEFCQYMEFGEYIGEDTREVRLIRAEKAQDALQKLPSVQSEIVRCKECKHYWIHRCMDSMPTEICDLGQTFYDPNADFCSLAERRTDE